MAKTTTSNFDIEKNKNTNSNTLVHLLEIVTSGGTVYYSDQNIIVGGTSYIANVFDWGDIENQLDTNEDVIRIGEVGLELSNFPRIDNVIDAGNIIRIYVWYNNLTSADKLKIFEGVIYDDISWTDQVISFTASDRSESFDKIIWNPLQTDSFPGTPDPDDVGKQMPIIYGDFKNHIPLVIDTGGVTTLTANILATGTANVLVTSTTNPIAFENSGSFYVGQEKFNYSGKTSTSFTGISRPGTKVAHSSGDGVFEDHLVKYLVANHITKTNGITNVRLMPKDGALKDAVDITSSVTINTDDSGKATILITAANIVTLRNLINVKVDQQPATSVLGDHLHTTSAVTLIERRGTGSAGAWNNLINARDASDVTFADVTTGTGAGFYHTFTTNDLGTIQEVRVVIKSEHTSGTNQLRISYKWNGSTYDEFTDIDGTLTTRKIITGITLWSQIGRLAADALVGSSNTFKVYEMYYEVDYIPILSSYNLDNTDIDIATTTSTEVIVTGNSQADSLGILICDIEGYMDDSPSHYTDSALSLIKEPWDIIHHLMENYGNGITDSDIDLAGSFQDAEDNLPSSYEFAFAIITRRALNRLLPLLARQTFCRIVYEAGLYKLIRIKLSGSSIQSINTNNDTVLKNDRLQVSIRKRGLDEIKNDIEIKYNLNPTLGGWNDENAYEGTSIDIDSSSITTYGNRQKSFLMFAIQDNSTMADDIANKLLLLLKDPRREITITTFLKYIELERGDIIDVTTPQLGISTDNAETINTRYSPFFGGKDPEVRITGLLL